MTYSFCMLEKDEHITRNTTLLCKDVDLKIRQLSEQ